MTMKSLRISILSVALSMMFVGVARAQAPQMPPAQVQTVTAEERVMAPQTAVNGTVISLNDSRLSAEVDGVLDWIAEVGTVVQAGDVIARLNDRLVRVQLDRASAAVKRFEADLSFREQEVTRFQSLASRDNASRSRLEEVIARREMLKQDLIEARSNLAKVAGDMERTEMRAPFSGHVVQKLANLGEYLTNGTEVIRLVDGLNKEIALPAPISAIPYLSAGQNVGVDSEFGQEMLAIRAVVPVGDQVSRMVEVRLIGVPESWAVGAGARIVLPNGPAETQIAVPRDAVILRGGQFILMRVSKDMTAEMINVQLGHAVDGWIGVIGDVKAGDMIVLRGGERLQPGQSVALQ